MKSSQHDRISPVQTASAEPLLDQEVKYMRYIRFKELRKLIPLGRTTIWRMMREGRFPQSRRIGRAAMAWVENEIDEWMKERAEMRK